MNKYKFNKLYRAGKKIKIIACSRLECKKYSKCVGTVCRIKQAMPIGNIGEVYIRTNNPDHCHFTSSEFKLL